MVIKFIDDLLTLAYEFNIKVRMILGTKSHDLNQLDNFKYLENSDIDFKIITKVQEEELMPNLSVLYVPEEYVINQNDYYKEFFKECDEETKYDLCFGHATWDFEALGDQIQESERPIKGSPVFKFSEWNKYFFGCLIFGHIHNKVFYKNKVYYTGSYSRWCYGEESSKGFLDIEYDISTTKHTVKFVENTLAPLYLTVKLSELIDMESTTEEKVQAIDKFKNDNKDVHVRLKIDMEIAKDEGSVAILKEAFSGDSNVKFDITERLEEEKKEELDTTFDFITKKEFDIPTTIQKYLNLTKGTQIPLEKIKLFIKADD
jgi:hypothetical protein